MKKQGKIIQKFVMFVKCIIVKFFMSLALKIAAK